MKPAEKLLLGLSAVAAVAPMIMARFPHEFTDIRTYSFYFLAVVPTATTAFGAAQAKERKWLSLAVLVFWGIAISFAALALCIWPTDPWAPVIWYAVSQGWLVGALLLVVAAYLLRYLDKKKGDPIGTDTTGLRAVVSDLNRSAEALMSPMLQRSVVKESLVFLACAVVGFVGIPAALIGMAEIEFGEFYESLFSPRDALFSWTVALAPYALCQAFRLALPFLKLRPFREEIRLVPEYLKCVLVVVGTGILFAVIWTFFSWGVNPLLIRDIFEHGADQSRLHLLALDSIDFIRNHGAVRWWYVLAIPYFSWTARKKQERTVFRRVGIAIYLAPFVALTVVFVLAAFQQVKMPNSEGSAAPQRAAGPRLNKPGD